MTRSGRQTAEFGQERPVGNLFRWPIWLTKVVPGCYVRWHCDQRQPTGPTGAAMAALLSKRPSTGLRRGIWMSLGLTPRGFDVKCHINHGHTFTSSTVELYPQLLPELKEVTCAC